MPLSNLDQYTQNNPLLASYISSGVQGNTQELDRRYNDWQQNAGQPGYTPGENAAIQNGQQISQPLSQAPLSNPMGRNAPAPSTTLATNPAGRYSQSTNTTSQYSTKPLDVTQPGWSLNRPLSGGSPSTGQVPKGASVGGESSTSSSGQDPFGRYGHINNYVSPDGSGRYETQPGWTPQSSGMPDWLQRQFRYNPGDPSGETPTPGHWELSGSTDNPFGAIQDANGNQVVQLGGDWQHRSGDQSVIDPNKVRYDPDLGYVTDPSNLRDVRENNTGRFLAMYAAMVGAGGLLNGGFGFDPSVGGVAGGAVNPAAAINGLPNTASMYGSVPITSGEIAGGATGAAGAGAGVGGGSTLGSTVSSIAGNPVTRAVAGPLVNSLTGGGGGGTRLGGTGGAGTGGTTPSGGSSNPFGIPDSIWNLISGGVNGYQDNREIQMFNGMMNGLLDRGDYNAQDRPAYLARLRQFITNPESALQDPTFKAVRERNLENLTRLENAHGYNMSGNELADLQQRGQELDWNQIKGERDALMRAADLGQPSQMSSAALRSLPFLFAMRGQRNFDVNRAVQGLGRGGNGTSNLPPWLREILGLDNNGGGGGTDETPTEVDVNGNPIDTSGGGGGTDTTDGWRGDGTDEDWWNWGGGP